MGKNGSFTIMHIYMVVYNVLSILGSCQVFGKKKKFEFFFLVRRCREGVRALARAQMYILVNIFRKIHDFPKIVSHNY